MGNEEGEARVQRRKVRTLTELEGDEELTNHHHLLLLLLLRLCVRSGKQNMKLRGHDGTNNRLLHG